jgi:hypothetical protein
MEKIILVISGDKPAPNVLDFACQLAGITRARLTGFFFQSQPIQNTQLYGLPFADAFANTDQPEQELYQHKPDALVESFRHTCSGKGIPASAHYTESGVLEALINESRFADLIVADAATAALDENDVPSSFMKQLLADAKCPVIVAPVASMPIEEIVFCYDGSPSSILAMKQFAYLLPELEDKKASAVQVKKDDDMPDEERRHITHWLSNHYTYSGFMVLKGSHADDELFTYLLKKRNAIVVMGAYGRNLLSMFLRRSQADLLIQSLAYPVFIAHT